MAFNKVVSDFVSAATAPQFDSSTTVATTEFVRREIGSRRGFGAYSSTAALTSADIGKSIQLGGIGGSVLTLPPASSGSTPGQIIEVFTNKSWTVAPSGTDLIRLGGASSTTSVALSPGDTAVFVSGGNGLWYLVGGTSSLRASDGDFGKSLASNGFQKLPSGLIIQWGSGSVGTISVDSNVSVAVTWPLAFPNAVLSYGVNAESPTAAVFANVTNPTTTGATLNFRNASPASSASSATGKYFAIGN